jgi:hypothetical protein
MLLRPIELEERIRRIRELCPRAAETEDPVEAREITSQLRIELHAQIAWLRDFIAIHGSPVSSDKESDENKCA